MFENIKTRTNGNFKYFNIPRLPELNRTQLKYIAIFLMLLCHASHVFCTPGSQIDLFINFISRITAPTMAFFIAEGYFYTRSLNKYLKRLFIFALVSAIPFVYMRTSTLLAICLLKGYVIPAIFYRPNMDIIIAPSIYLSSINSTLVIQTTSIIFTLFLGLFSIYLWDKIKIPNICKLIVTGFIFYLAYFANFQYFIVLWCLIFYFFRDNDLYKWTLFVIVGFSYAFDIHLLTNAINLGFCWNFIPSKLGFLLVPFFFLLYNGEPGGKSKFHKCFFYIFYPAHMLVLGFIGYVLL